MKGRSVFDKREVEQIASLILRRCSATSTQQKAIRAKMRSMGFYGSDFGITDMTIGKFQHLIESGRITISDDHHAKLSAKTTVEKEPTQEAGQMKRGLEAWIGKEPRILILGTFPGEKSLATQAYYQNKSHNSFFKLMESLFERPIGISDKEFVTGNHIALWDCMKEADRKGSLDSNIKRYLPNDIEGLLARHPSILAVILNGTGETTKVFEQNFSTMSRNWNCRVISLPSTSNSLAKPFEEKVEEWRIIKDLVNG